MISTFSRKVILSPLEIPGGIYNYYAILEFLMPVALQSGHGCLITNPIPLHRVHSRCITIELCLNMVDPDPPQAKHLVGAVPDWHLLPLQVLQVSRFSYYNLTLAPFIASTKLIFTYLFISSPFFLLVDPVEYVSW